MDTYVFRLLQKKKIGRDILKLVEAWQQPVASFMPASPERRQTVSANPAFMRLLQSRHVLLLQGPLGPFFDRLAHWLGSLGCRVDRVVFHGGDLNDCRAVEPLEYRDTPERWPTFLQDLLERESIDCIVLFGQAREYHVAAIELARLRGLAVVVLEEGYFRPGYVTMELDGVNGYSTTLQRFVWSRVRAVEGEGSWDAFNIQLTAPASTEWQFQKMAWHAMVHYSAMAWSGQRFPHYRHHKATSVIHYATYWLRSWAKKWWHWAPDRMRQSSLRDHMYYFVPLQHDGDAQILHHSPFRANTEFILQVLTSFANHAPDYTYLVFRQHPHARGGRGHGRLIRSLARELGVSDRVLHLVDGHTPTLVKYARGVVVINSTVGLQALTYNKPLKVMGEALYHISGLTFQGELHEFWGQVTPPNAQMRKHALNQIRHLTQMPCNVYAFATESLRWVVSRKR